MQASHNKEFHDMACKHAPELYYDWKITCLFYVAIHYLKALAHKRKKDIGDHHHDINRNIKRGKHNPTMPISDTAYDNYMRLFHYSQSARYDGFENVDVFNKMKKADYAHALKCFENFEKFIISSGIKIKSTPATAASKAVVPTIPATSTLPTPQLSPGGTSGTEN